MLSFQMTKTFRDNCDINIVQQTSCELLFPDFSNAVKMYFFVPSVHLCMHHKYGVISGRHTSADCVWPMPVVPGLCMLWRTSASIIRFDVTFVPLRLYCEKMCTCFLNDGKSPTIHGCALWCSQIVYIRPSLNTTTPIYFVTECPDVPVWVASWKFQ